MRTFDPTPLWRSTVGFDRLLDLIDTSLSLPGDDNYPPYNIERTGEDAYHISLALAGFTPDEVTVTAEQNMLTVEGRRADKGQRELLYRGISSRPFKRQFVLAAHVRVEGARFDNGLLQVELLQESPHAIKPRRIPIENLSAFQQIEREAA